MKDLSIIRFMETTPWAITSEHYDVLCSVIANHLAGNVVALSGSQPESPMSMMGDTAIISISGTISKKLYGLEAVSGGYTTDNYKTAIQEALQNPKVSAIILLVRSPGGTVAGTKELADFIYESREIKPIVAYTDEQMCSAAFWIGSGAEKIVIYPTAMAGSIGVITKHKDWSKAEENEGSKTTFIYRGKYKSAGNSSEPLSEESKAYMQSNVDEYYTIFVNDVARNLGISVEKAQELADARVHIGQKAKDIGLAHHVGNMEYAMHVAKQLKKHKKEKMMMSEEATKQLADMQAKLEEQSNALATLQKEAEEAKAALAAKVAAEEKSKIVAGISEKLSAVKVVAPELAEALVAIPAATTELVLATISGLATKLNALTAELGDTTQDAHSEEASTDAPTTMDDAVAFVAKRDNLTDIDAAISVASTEFPKLFGRNS